MTNDGYLKNDENHLFADAPQVRVLLADRMTLASRKCEKIRQMALTAYTPSEFSNIADRLAVELARLEELTKVWNALFTDIPSILTIGQLTTIR